MKPKVSKVVWTRQAKEALNEVLDYRYDENPTARKIVRTDIIQASMNITYPKQFQKDEIFPDYRRIIVRDYKILYSSKDTVVYILNVVCTLSLNKD